MIWKCLIYAMPVDNTILMLHIIFMERFRLQFRIMLASMLRSMLLRCSINVTANATCSLHFRLIDKIIVFSSFIPHRNVRKVCRPKCYAVIQCIMLKYSFGFCAFDVQWYHVQCFSPKIVVDYSSHWHNAIHCNIARAKQLSYID